MGHLSHFPAGKRERRTCDRHVCACLTHIKDDEIEMKTRIRESVLWLLSAIVLSVSAPVFAQDDMGEEVDMASQSLEDDSEMIEAEIRDMRVPDGSEDYAELQEMRVLERTLIPGMEAELPTENRAASSLVQPGDPLELSHASVLEMLLNETGETETRGLQQHATRIMSHAMSQVSRILDQADSSTGLIKPFGIDCLHQPAVREYLALYSSTGSKGFKVWLQRSGKWHDLIEQVMREEGVPGDLLYLAMIESGFKTRVKSPKAAGGMWQFMPGTGVEMGLRIDQWVDERFDPIKAAHAAARYLKKQYQRFESWPLAMAAYNGGPGLVNAAIDKYNTNDFFKLVSYGAMYDETRRYAPKILAAATIGKNPDAFGYGGLVLEKPLRFDTVEVPGGTRLERIAEASGSKLEEIEELNPELLKRQTPPNESWIVRIPKGSASKFVEKFDALSTKYRSTESYVVRFGETIETMSARSGQPARVIQALNHIDSRENVLYGSSILLPAGASVKIATFEQQRRDAASSGTLKEEERLLALIPKPEFSLPKERRYFYVTQRGDQLYAIAEAFGVTLTQLALWNDLDIYARLRPNMVIQVYVDPGRDLSGVMAIPENEARIVIKGSEEHRAMLDAKSRTTQAKAKSAAATVPAASKVVYYTVGKGDTLSKIAKKYGVTVDQLMKWNKLKDAGSIRKGQKLIVKK